MSTTVRAGRSLFAIVSALSLGAGGLLFGFTLTAIAGAIAIYGLGLELTIAAQIVLGLVLVQGVGCAGVTGAYLKFRPAVAPPIRRLFGFGEGDVRFHIGASVPDLRELIVVVAGYIFALSGAVAGAMLVSQTGAETGQNQAAEFGLQAPETLLLLIPASILLIGPGEELLFRGVVQGRLRETFGPAVAIAIASALFAGLHWFALSGGTLTGNLLVLGVLLVPAAVFGVSYEYTDNIVVPALIHGLYNATLFSLLYVAITFSDQLGPALL